MPRGGKRNTNQQQQNQLASVFGAPPGLQSSSQNVASSASEPATLAEYGAPPGLSTEGSSSSHTPQALYGQPPPGFEHRFPMVLNPSAPAFQPQSMTNQQSGSTSVPSQVILSQRPKESKPKKPKQPKQQQKDSKQSQESSNDPEQNQNEPPSESTPFQPFDEKNMMSESKQKNPKNRGGGRQRQNSQNQQQQNYREFRCSTEECVLCVQRSDVFGIGQCKHAACMECIIRMRCLDGVTKCHTCRGEVPLMHFVMKPAKWETYQLPACDTPHPDRDKFNICFENQYVADLYDKLNAFTCQICQRNGEFAEFPTFAALKTHMGQQHRLFYCHICQDHLNILPRFRRTFNDKELNLHMTGKKNVVMGVRGHPKCQFCNERYFDEEELYKHSRQKHHFCSICSNELGTNQFFNHSDQLLKHYKQKHHPCLEPDCQGLVFSNEFDLNVHKTERHGGNDRRIPIDFQFTRGTAYPEASNRVTNQGAGVSLISANNPPLPSRLPSNIIPSAQANNRPVNIVQRAAPPATFTERHDFPSLTSSAPNAYNQGTNWRSDVVAARNQVQQRPASLSMQQQIGSATHFPTLGGGSSSSHQTSSTVWSSGKTAEIMKKPPPKPKAPSPKPVRKKIIPLPEVWPENMRKKLEAREKGLPEPPDDEPPLPQPVEKKKEKKPKKKTVGVDVLRKRLNNEIASLPGTNSKFSALTDYD